MMHATMLTTSADAECDCSTRHVPKPLVWFEVDGPQGAVVLCPTAAFNLQRLLAEYDLYEGDPPGKVTKQFGKFIRDLAEQIYDWR